MQLSVKQISKMATKSLIRSISSYKYEIPQRYSDAFYLANAAFFDSVSWYLHRAYQAHFPRLMADLQEANPAMKDVPESAVIEEIKSNIAMFDQCSSILDVRFPIHRDNGKKEIIRAFRAQHGLFSGYQTCLGGVRIKEDITRDHMKALAVLSTYKHSCMGIRLGGAHGGIKINPIEYSESELKRIVQAYCVELFQKGYCNGMSDILEPDINTSEREMTWIANSLPANLGKSIVVGKPVKMGGVENHEKSAGQGVYFALDYVMNHEALLKRLGINNKGLKQKTFIIQGLGKLGMNLMQYMEHSGAVCVGVKEHDSYIYDRRGINIQSLVEYYKEKRTLQGFGKAKPISDNEIFTKECDILILSAQQKSLICYTADKVKAKVVVEAANGSVTPTAHRILLGKSKLVLPDLYVCSGYSIASYFEHLVGLKSRGRDVDFIRGIYKSLLANFDAGEAQEKCQMVSVSKTQKMITCEIKPDVLAIAIEHVMTETMDELLDIAKQNQLDLDLRSAAYIKAIRTLHFSLFDEKLPNKL